MGIEINIQALQDRYLGYNVDPMSQEQLTSSIFHHIVESMVHNLLRGDMTVKDYVDALLLAQIQAYERRIYDMSRAARRYTAPGSLDDFPHIQRKE